MNVKKNTKKKVTKTVIIRPVIQCEHNFKIARDVMVQDMSCKYLSLTRADTIYCTKCGEQKLFTSRSETSKEIVEEKKMQTLKDIKEALSKIPDDILEKCGFGLGENYEDTVGLIVFDDDYPEIFDKYPDLDKIDNLVQNIKKAQVIVDTQDNTEILEDLQQDGLSDTYFDNKQEENKNENKRNKTRNSKDRHQLTGNRNKRT